VAETLGKPESVSPIGFFFFFFHQFFNRGTRSITVRRRDRRARSTDDVGRKRQTLRYGHPDEHWVSGRGTEQKTRRGLVPDPGKRTRHSRRQV